MRARQQQPRRRWCIMSCEKRSMPNQLCLNEVEEHDEEMVVSRVSGRAGFLPASGTPPISPADQRNCHEYMHALSCPKHVCVVNTGSWSCFQFPLTGIRRRSAVNEHSVKKPVVRFATPQLRPQHDSQSEGGLVRASPARRLQNPIGIWTTIQPTSSPSRHHSSTTARLCVLSCAASSSA